MNRKESLEKALAELRRKEKQILMELESLEQRAVKLENFEQFSAWVEDKWGDTEVSLWIPKGKTQEVENIVMNRSLYGRLHARPLEDNGWTIHELAQVLIEEFNMTVLDEDGEPYHG